MTDRKDFPPMNDGPRASFDDSDNPLRATRPVGAPPENDKKGGFSLPSISMPAWLAGILKVFGWLAALGAVAAVGVIIYAFIYVSGLDLPPYEQLEDYEPAVTTRVHAGDGTLVAEFARERRLFVPVEVMPVNVKNAFLSAEDKNFYNHGGLSYVGMIRANLTNAQNIISGRGGPLEGGSTITQQVAKNFLLTSEQKIERKVKEMLIARRMERAFTKDRILELYLNEIYLGNRSYGVAAAALNYFGKSLEELTIPEAAYLATLAKAPSNYHPVYNEDRALARRNWIINRMHEDGHITRDQMEEAQASPLGAEIAPPLGARSADMEYFAEEVRKEVASRYTVEALYDGGLSVRTTLDPALQRAANRAFRKWLTVYDQRHGWRGEVSTISLPDDLDETASLDDLREGEEQPLVWQQRLGEEIQSLADANKYAEDLAPWELGVVLTTGQNSATVGLADGSTRTLPLAAATWARAYVNVDALGPEVTDLRRVIEPGDVIYVEPYVTDAGEEVDGQVALRQIPAVNGGMMVMDPHTGRVLAMVGGFSFGLSEFNRATQANRQPGSTFKPFVYAAAIDNGYTPSSIVLDAPFVAPSLGDDWWKPGNYIAGRFYGESTLRLGIEKSRNTMTARLAQDVGIDMIIDYAERFGVSDTLPRELAISLGAGETSLPRLTSAYSMFVNGGRKIQPVLIDRIQNRYGETIYKRDTRTCVDCNVEDWEEQPEPYIADLREQVIDPRTAYQMVSILEGVVQRGTGTRVREAVPNKPIAGKTGTTDDYKDAWFVGFTPDLAAGIYVGFDLPASMGQGEGGGIVAAPIFGEFMAEALADEPAQPFRVPSGIRLVRVDAKTGRPARPGQSDVILEAFKAEDNIDGTSSFAVNGTNIDEGNTDENIDDDLGGLY